MDWKLKYDYDGWLILHCTSVGDYCAKEISLEDERAFKQRDIDEINKKIAVVYELQMEAEEREDKPDGVYILSREVARLQEIRKKLRKEWQQIHKEVGKEKDKNQLCRDYYADQRNLGRLSTFQYKK